VPDFDPYSVPAPLDSRLPNGGGYTVSGLLDLNPNKVGQVLNYNTLSDNYGRQIEHWNGFDISTNARLRGGVVIFGGISSGKTLTDNCDIAAALPEMNPVNGHYCHVEEPMLTQVKVSGSYPIPRIDVQVSATFQSIPGPGLSSNLTATNALVLPSLKRNLSSGANATVNLIEPSTMFGERVNQLDIRFGKILRYGRTRTSINLDVYNALNKDTVLTSSAAYASWLRPTTVLPARFAKIGVQFDF